MFRPSRRVISALLWVAIALLPLRGFAAALMPAADAPSHTGAAVTQSAPPCHGGEAQGPIETAAGAHAGCSLCDLCHSTALAAEPPSLRLAPLVQAGPPLHGAAALDARAPDGLFRPPRATLA